MSEEVQLRRWTSPIGIFLLVSAGAMGCALLWWMYLLFLRPPLTRDMVRPGMTVEQVEAVFGKPTSVREIFPGEEWRSYSNDGKHYVNVEFKNGRVFHLEEHTRDTRLIKVG